MDYNSYPELPGYFGLNCHDNPPYHYHPGYQHYTMMSYEPIVPHANDILMGRGGKNNQHIGNEKLRKLARKEAKEYCTSSKKGKSRIAKGLVTKVRQMQPPGRFLKRNPVTSEWEDVGDEYAREKASQVLRDAVALLPDAGEAEKQEDKEEDKSDADTDSMPELVAVEEVKEKKRAKNVRKEKKPNASEETDRNLKRKLISPPLSPYYPSSSNANPSVWHYNQPIPPLPAPPLKRHRSNNFFEHCAFFGTGDSSRSLGAFPIGPPCLSQQDSLCFSVGNVSLPGIIIDEEDIAELTQTDFLVPPDLKSATSSEFLSDFY
jgi:hypothetical protein